MALDIGRTESNPSTLLGGDASAWNRSGVSPDSIARLTQVASALGLPVSGGGAPSGRPREAMSWLGRLDDVRDSLRTLTLTTYASGTREGALGFGPLAAPASGGEQKELTLGGQFVHSQFVGVGHRVLTQNRMGYSQGHQSRRCISMRPVPRYSCAPHPMLRPTTWPHCNSAAIRGWPRTMALDTRGVERNDLEARGSKHRLKSQLWFRGDGLSRPGVPTRSDSTRSTRWPTSGQPTFVVLSHAHAARSIGDDLEGATAFAHQWNKSRWFSMLYGARVEGSMFGEQPPRIRRWTPRSVCKAASRRVTCTCHRESGSRTRTVVPRTTATVPTRTGSGSYRTALGYIRGGIGEFRDLYRPLTLTDVMAGAGLAGSTLTLNCVGSAVPVPDWESLSSPNATLPTTCADGGGALAERAPSVTLVDPSFDVPRSWRASLNWGTNIRKWSAQGRRTGSYDLSLPSTLDANFAGNTRFMLAAENNRPVFVTPAAIDTSTGAVSARESRKSSDYGRVTLRSSDLRG